MNNNNNNSKDEDDGFKSKLQDILKGFNRYATKKTISQGFLDLALLFTNIAQLKEIQHREKDAIYYAIVASIGISMGLQIIAGGILFFIGKMNYADDKRVKLINTLNNVTSILFFIITLVNVAISVLWIFTDEKHIASNSAET